MNCVSITNNKVIIPRIRLQKGRSTYLCGVDGLAYLWEATELSLHKDKMASMSCDSACNSSYHYPHMELRGYEVESKELVIVLTSIGT